jgi:hypothetical protein
MRQSGRLASGTSRSNQTKMMRKVCKVYALPRRTGGSLTLLQELRAPLGRQDLRIGVPTVRPKIRPQPHLHNTPRPLSGVPW